MELKIIKLSLLLFLLSNLFTVASENDETQIETTRSGYWTYYCKNHVKQRECDIARKIIIEEKNENFLIIYKISKNINSKMKETLSITTPPTSKVDINKRLKISFDEKTKITKSFAKCEDHGCLAFFKGNRILKYSMKNFDKMKITFFALGDEEPTSLTLPMDGFSEALKSITQQLKSY